MKHTNLEYEYTFDELLTFIKNNYKQEFKDSKKLTEKVFDDINYINELLYLESLPVENAEERYSNIIKKVIRKYA